MQTLEAVIVRGNNNFGLIRLITASLVIINHANALFPHNYQIMETGYLRLWVFFFLSGLFITSSFANSKTYSSFIIMRISRLWPALIVCTFLTVFVLGPLVTEVPVSEYFSSKLTWLYLVCNSIIFNLKYFLPGVFADNYMPGVVNNPLWTIPLELKCYGMVFMLGFLGFFRNKLTVIVGYAIITIYLLHTKMNFWELNSGSMILYMLFMLGSLCFFFRKQLIIDYRIAIGLLIVLLFAHLWSINKIVFSLILQIALMYGAITLGASNVFKRVKLPGDYSYGMYIYGFLVQQTIANYLPHISPLVSLVYTLPIAALLGALSWHIIENPALKFGKKLAKMTKPEMIVWGKSKLKM